MIDVHSHIIFDVDDGPSCIEESLKMISEASEAGIKVIIATPHFHKDIFETDRIIENYYKLVEKSSDYNVGILLGYEVFLDPVLPKMLKEKNLLTLNKSRFMLLELPFDLIPAYTYETIYKLQLLNIIPIIAHPERNRNLIKNFEIITSLMERGCLIQVDAASILGVYGKRIKEYVKKIIKLKLVHFIASDAHSAQDYNNWYKEAYSLVIKWAGEAYADKVFNKNAIAIIDNIKESSYEIV